MHLCLDDTITSTTIRSQSPSRRPFTKEIKRPRSYVEDVAALTPVRQAASLHHMSQEQRSISPHSISHSHSPERLTHDDNMRGTLETVHSEKIASLSPKHHVTFIKSSLDTPGNLASMPSSIPAYIPHPAPIPEEQVLATVSTAAAAKAQALVSDV